MHNCSANNKKIVGTLRTIESKENFLHQIRQLKLGDIELIGMDLIKNESAKRSRQRKSPLNFSHYATDL
ncbi:hypothetical protein EZS27_028127 [termite gut metagenome]|uniref:Uncharacterized protein n=1 Tax=termite gut metagenome TaxID=433724 RepID=A0A5J4QKA2_9ZZZZ